MEQENFELKHNIKSVNGDILIAEEERKKLENKMDQSNIKMTKKIQFLNDACGRLLKEEKDELTAKQVELMNNNILELEDSLKNKPAVKIIETSTTDLDDRIGKIETEIGKLINDHQDNGIKKYQTKKQRCT